MKRFLTLLIVFFLAIPIFISAQENKDKQAGLNSQLIEKQSKALDDQILELYKHIEEVISSSNLMSPEGIKYLPYQTDVFYGTGNSPDIKYISTKKDDKEQNKEKPQFIELVKHIYIKEGVFSGNLIGYEEKTLRLYSDGKKLDKMETIVRTRNFRTQTEEIITVVDSSPTSGNKDDITVTHTKNTRKILDKKKLGEILNNIDLPIKNEIKSDFMIPNLVALHKNLLFITESNLKSSKDVDMNAADYLKKSTYY